VLLFVVNIGIIECETYFYKGNQIMIKLITTLFSMFFYLPAFAWQPTKPIEVTISFPPGSGNDIVFRPLAEVVERNTGVKFLIVNRSGAGGVVGNTHFVKQPNDGHHINVIAVGGVSAMDYIWPAFSKNPPYDVNSFSYATALATSSLVIVANKNDPVSTPEEFVQTLLTDKNVTVADSGAANRLALETILLSTRAREINPGLVRVEHRGPVETVADVIGGHVRFGSMPLPNAYPHYKDGSLKIIGLIQQSTIPGLNIASFVGVNKNIKSNTVWGLALPKGAPPEALEWYAKVFKEAQQDKKVREIFAKNQFYPVEELQTPKKFASFVFNEHKQHSEVVKVIIKENNKK